MTTSLAMPIAQLGSTLRKNARVAQDCVLPRIAACALGVMVLTVLFDAIALFGGLVATWWLAHLPPSDYVASLKLALGATTFGLVLTKAAICGAGIAFISCWAGMRT